jgi:hypothetical protein
VPKKVCWSTFQIVSTISWNLSVRYPAPFSSLLFALGFLQLDFLSLDCVSGETNYFNRVYAVSVTPILFSAVNAVVFALRLFFNKAATEVVLVSSAASSFNLLNNVGVSSRLSERFSLFRGSGGSGGGGGGGSGNRPADLNGKGKGVGGGGVRGRRSSSAVSRQEARVGAVRKGAYDARDAAALKIVSQHAFGFLLLSYLVLPPVAMLQFQALGKKRNVKCVLLCLSLQCCNRRSIHYDPLLTHHHTTHPSSTHHYPHPLTAIHPPLTTTTVLDCVTLGHDGSRFLKADSAIDCDSPEYKAFQAVDLLFVIIYQVVWLVGWLVARSVGWLVGLIAFGGCLIGLICQQPVFIEFHDHFSSLSFIPFLLFIFKSLHPKGHPSAVAGLTVACQAQAQPFKRGLGRASGGREKAHFTRASLSELFVERLLAEQLVL